MWEDGDFNENLKVYYLIKTVVLVYQFSPGP